MKQPPRNSQRFVGEVEDIEIIGRVIESSTTTTKPVKETNDGQAPAKDVQ